MYISGTQKQNPYIKPNPFKIPVKFKANNLSLSEYSNSNASSSSRYLNNRIQYWKFNDNHSKSNSYLHDLRKQPIKKFEKQLYRGGLHKDKIYDSATIYKHHPETNSLNYMYNYEGGATGTSNPFYRKNLILSIDKSLEEEKSGYHYNKYLAKQINNNERSSKYPVLNLEYDGENSRRSSAKRNRQSQAINESVNYSIVLGLFDKKSSYQRNSNTDRPQLNKVTSRKSPRASLSQNQLIVNKKQTPKEISVRGRKFFLKGVYEAY